MQILNHKTRIICTIGPASQSLEVLENMIRAGMNVARLNFSHGDFEGHRKTIENIRAAARAVDRNVAIMVDLPGPKIRIGQLAKEPIKLKIGENFTLTTEKILGDAGRVSMTFLKLPEVVKPKDTLFLNDGLIQLEVRDVTPTDVHCRVMVGGQLWSRKGLNLPGIDLGIQAFTERDREHLAFALSEGVDAVSQSFVESVADINAVREAAAALGHEHVFVIAKIERSRALENVEQILDAADGIMIARGDLGVEIPIEQIAVVQKHIIRLANLKGKPVITATQMLESMTSNRRPTRAESTDVANAVLDGTDCVMLSGESAMGEYPVDSTAMLAKIAETVESHRTHFPARELLLKQEGETALKDLIALSVLGTVERTSPAAVFVPSRNGITARSITRFRLPLWITAVSRHETTCRELMFSYGIHPYFVEEEPEDWKTFAKEWLKTNGLKGDLVLLTSGPSSRHPDSNNRMEIISLTEN